MLLWVMNLGFAGGVVTVDAVANPFYRPLATAVSDTRRLSPAYTDTRRISPAGSDTLRTAPASETS